MSGDIGVLVGLPHKKQETYWDVGDVFDIRYMMYII